MPSVSGEAGKELYRKGIRMGVTSHRFFFFPLSRSFSSLVSAAVDLRHLGRCCCCCCSMRLDTDGLLPLSLFLHAAGRDS